MSFDVVNRMLATTGAAELWISGTRPEGANAVDVQRVEGICYFFGALIDVWKRQHGKRAEAALVIALQLLQYSFDSHATRTAVDLSSPITCGVVGEVMAVATPPLSMSSSVFCTDQFVIGGLSLLILLTASSQVGGET
jgi:hypothetical protein